VTARRLNSNEYSKRWDARRDRTGGNPKNDPIPPLHSGRKAYNASNGELFMIRPQSPVTGMWRRNRWPFVGVPPAWSRSVDLSAAGKTCTAQTARELSRSSLRFATLAQRHDSLWAMFPGIERRVANEETIPDCRGPRSPKSAAVGGRARPPLSAFRHCPSLRMGSRADAASGPLAPAHSAPIAPRSVPAGP
jgi:hypothetical protein